MTKKQFIDTIGRIARTVNQPLDSHVLPSICIAQACLESGYGQVENMMKYNAPFGIKATKSWKGAIYNSVTGEYHDNNFNLEEATFRAYPDLEAAVKDYYDVIAHSGYYPKVVNEYDVDTAVDGLKAYATDPNYISKIKSIIKSQNLTRYDEDMDFDTESSAINPHIVIVNADIIDGDKEYVYDKNNEKNRLWYRYYDVLQVKDSYYLIGIGVVPTCWVDKNKCTIID